MKKSLIVVSILLGIASATWAQTPPAQDVEQRLRALEDQVKTLQAELAALRGAAAPAAAPPAPAPPPAPVRPRGRPDWRRAAGPCESAGLRRPDLRQGLQSGHRHDQQFPERQWAEPRRESCTRADAVPDAAGERGELSGHRRSVRPRRL